MNRLFNVPAEVAYVFWLMIAVHAITDTNVLELNQYILPLLLFVPDRYGDLLGYGVVDNLSSQIALLGGTPLLETVSYYLSPVGYMFLHANWIHVLFNGAMLLAFGKMTAPYWGRWVWLIFVFAGSAASAFFAASVERFDGLVGASGAVSALIAGVLVPSIMGLGPLQKSVALSQFIMWVVMLVVFPIVAQDWLYDMTGSYVSWTGHAGGLLFGAIVAPLLGRR